MASAELRIAARTDWVLANPWSWMLAGLGVNMLAWLRMLVLWSMDRVEDLTFLPPLAVFLGLLLAGTGIAVRLNSAHEVFLERLRPATRLLILRGLMLFFGLVALSTTVLLVLRILGVQAMPWRPGQTIIFWLIAAPLSLVAASMCLRRLKPGAYLSRSEDAAALLVLFSLTIFFAFWGLYFPDDIEAWDSMRLFLAIFALVPLIGAALVMVPRHVQRLFITFLIFLHFAAIGTAVLSAPPTPWLIGQVWTRLARPYLEFMYLNNAYHFYAPEPGPASHLWFRLFYEDPNGGLWGTWYKIPDVDDKGRHRNAVALEYQRILAITENTVPTDPLPAPGEWLYRRMLNSPQHAASPVIIGQKPPPSSVKMKVPFHPAIIPETNQFLPPNWQSLELLKSYARHVCRLPHSKHKDWKVKKVKIYRVVHNIPPIEDFADAFNGEGRDPRDPELYRPYFMGEYDPQGVLLDPDDPFLYWLLPILRYNQHDENKPPEKKSNIRNWALKHADDPAWVLEYSEIEKLHRPKEGILP